ncbi:MAG TPA: nuclear transport factor 2 family protein [Candidatus Thermoplasmatota archaeon]|nr:nuclear transport factor 2 family protein [Candidatus Thermoplasmatota archaeon]
MSAESALTAYVDAHNEGVRTADYSRLAALLHAEAEMTFKGQRVGPYIGRDAILRAFKETAPGAELRVLEVQSDRTGAEARYGWVGAAATVAGVLRIEPREGKVARIEVRAFSVG